LLAGERQSESAQQRETLLVRLGRGRDRDVQAPHLRDVVVVDLGKDELLADAERVVAAPVERVRAQAPEVADPRELDLRVPVEQLKKSVAAQLEAREDRHRLADL
jgi:hypothetical protein